MNAYRKLGKLLAFALTAALCAGSTFAMDPTQVRGSFTLPFEAHWGNATLPAGKYTFEAVGIGHPFIEVRGEAKGSTPVFVIVLAHNLSQSANTSELVCIRQGNTGIVHSLVLKGSGEILYFPVPKNLRLYAHNGNAKTRTLLAQDPDLIQRVPVEVAGL